MSTPTYGVGDSAEKLNIGATHSTVSRLADDGSVSVDDKKVFDPKEDSVAYKGDDGELSDQAEGKDEGAVSVDQTSRTKR